MTPVTISGVGVVDADIVIDRLVAKIAELTLENAALVALCGQWQAVAVANVTDPADRRPQTTTRPSHEPSDAIDPAVALAGAPNLPGSSPDSARALIERLQRPVVSPHTVDL